MMTTTGLVPIFLAMTSSLGADVSQIFASSEPMERIAQSCAGLDDISFVQATLHAPSAKSAMLATRHRLDCVTDDPKQLERAEALKPVAWLHIPKAGTSFINVLYHTPTLCPNTPDDAFLDSAVEFGGLKFLDTECPRWECCPGGWSSTFPPEPQALHVPIADLYDANAGHFVTMMRQPEQRIISHYKMFLDDPRVFENVDEPPKLKDFAEDMQGCMVKEIGRLESKHWCVRMYEPPPTEEELARAVRRLQNGFAFVGLTEDWDSSVCLFHAMFGGACKEKEFLNTRPGENRTTPEPYDTSELEGFADVYDGELYAEAERIFRMNLLRYDVADGNCPGCCT